MDPSSGQPAPAPARTPASRDMMFCHECADEWYRDEHGLTCPECGSDFTEIIEDNNDPRDSVMFADDGGDDSSMPDLDEPLRGHNFPNPHAHDDPEEDDISNLQFRQTAPGRFNVQATITRSVSPQQFRAAGGMAPATIGGFMSMLTGLAAGQVQGQQTRGPSVGPFSRPNQNQNRSFSEETRSSERADGQPRVHASRFTYTGGARLYPRDANNPEPHVEPVDEITNVVTGLMAALGAAPGNVNAQRHHAGGAEAHFHYDNDDDRPGDPPMHAGHPFLQLLNSFGVMGGGGSGQMGDFVYSQEGLDRIVSQLMEQTATSNAPGPAPQSDIENLPRKKVDEEMLGTEHKAECSICMDEVNIGEEVTVLPCKHWFHHQCVSAWLGEHDTCPHCRKSISKGQAEQASDPTSGTQTSSGAQGSGSRQMPGAFDVSGSGTAHDPYNVPDDGLAGSQTQGGSSDNNVDAGNGGISDRIRRGLFGPQQ